MRARVTKAFGGHRIGDVIDAHGPQAERWQARGRIKPVGPESTKPDGPRYVKEAKGGGWFVALEHGREVYKGREAAVDRFIEERA